MSKIQKKRGAAWKKPVIFVVEDEPMIDEVVKVILELEGIQAEVFQVPTAALAALKKNGSLTCS